MKMGNNLALCTVLAVSVYAIDGMAAEKDKSKLPPGEPQQFKLITKQPIRALPLFEMEDAQTSALGDQAIVVQASPTHAYLFTLSRACPGLNMGDGILITNTAGEIEAGFDEVIVGPERERCPIDKIYPIANQRDIEAAEQAAKKKP